MDVRQLLFTRIVNMDGWHPVPSMHANVYSGEDGKYYGPRRINVRTYPRCTWIYLQVVNE